MPIPSGVQLLNPQEVIAKSGLSIGMQVADLGCGSLGYFVFPFSRQVGKEGLVYAVDILKPALDSVKNRAKLEGLTNVQTIWSNLEKVGATDIKKNSLDIAYLINTLFQNANYEAMIKEAIRLVKPGGKLVIIDWKKMGTPLGPEAKMRLGAEDVTALTVKLGLRVQEETDFGQYFWGVILSK